MTAHAHGMSRGALLFLALLFPASSPAHTFDVPEEVQAGADGSFSYQVVLTVGPGPLSLASYGWSGVENVDDFLIADCFCTPSCTLEEGETLVIDVDAVLVDPDQPGRVDANVALCEDPGFFGSTTILPEIVSVGDRPEPPVARLSNLPNPFASRTTFSLSLESEGHVTLRVYDVDGRLRAEPLDRWLTEGTHTAEWFARTGTGERLPAGVYFARLDVDGVVVTQRVTITE